MKRNPLETQSIGSESIVSAAEADIVSGSPATGAAGVKTVPVPASSSDDCAAESGAVKNDGTAKVSPALKAVTACADAETGGIISAMPSDRIGSANLATLLALVWFHMRNLWSTAFFRETALLTPVSFLLLKVIAARWAVADSLWFDAAVCGMWATTTTAVGIIGFQRFQGVLQYLVASTLPAWAVFAPVVAAAALIGVAGLPLSLTGSVVVCWLTGQPVPAVTGLQAVGYLLAALACVASAALLSSVFVLSRHAIAFEPLLLVPVWLLCGIVTPTSASPLPLRAVAYLHPLTAAVSVAQSDAWNGSVWACVAWCVALSVVWLLASARGLRTALRLACRKGTLGLS